MDRGVFKIEGMDCAEEVTVLRHEVGPIVGGPENLSFDLMSGTMTVLNGAAIPREEIVRAVRRAGMSAETADSSPGRRAETPGFWVRNGRTLTTVVSGAAVLGGVVYHAAQAGLGPALGLEAVGVPHLVPPVSRLFYAAAVVAGGWYVAPRASGALRRLRPDMNLLMTIAVVGAIAIGEWLEAALVAFLFAVSLALESWSVGRARRAVEALLDLAPPVVRVWLGGREVETPAAEVAVGSVFLVKPGDRIPLDGEVLSGITEVNQAPITGESLPVLKEAGSEVFAGTINGDGALEVRSTRPAGETTLAHIIRLVGAAQARRAPSEQWVDRFARYYTPAVFAAAVLVFLVPPVIVGADWAEWTYRALVLLVIGCPCALVISTPVSIVAALAASARNGVLIKGGVWVEAPASLRAIALDKTGTLTEGRPRVMEVFPEPDVSAREVLEIAAGLESRSDHPLARAVAEFCRAENVAPRPMENVTALQGRGVRGSAGDREYWAGSHRYFEEKATETPEIHARLERFAAHGRSVVVVGSDRRVLGWITLADGIRAESRDAVAGLGRAGIEQVVMLTGDNQATADSVARATGIGEVRAELLPADKVTAVEKLVEEYGRVAMVGDGINDAPAMARATLGIAMGAMGSDAAVETADIALMSDDLSKVGWLIRHSRRTLRIIRQNIVLSLGVKALFVTLTFSGFASLWAAIAADMGVSLLVIFNAMRLLYPGSPDESLTPGSGHEGTGALAGPDDATGIEPVVRTSRPG